ncbi:LAMI_0F14092g1_1 [Lachancea mirantina]|uniref:LAMI_0F14092g1_1 n=1 Tax=Lachancea mirantina TaxID=1230905 RepID=A0A1G4K3N7_9SACH|nr:LAMI_0F14092g1_1 [Lachancea mirantina]
MSFMRRDSSGSVTSAGIMHHQGKLDVFIIKAYRVLSRGALINGDDVSIANTASSSPKSGVAVNAVNGMGQQGDLSLFQRLSQLYNATISTSLLDDNSTSPKSAIELYQRFQQIMKEMELSFEISPYSKYFRRLDNGLWQIKDDAELAGDQLWQLVSVSIATVYDVRTGQMLSQPRKRVNSLAASSKNSPSEMVDNTLPQQLQKRLQKLQQDSKNANSVSPVSPSVFSQPGTASGNGNGNGALSGAGPGSRSKRKYMGVETPDEEAVEELLQLATKKHRADLPTIDEDAVATAAAPVPLPQSSLTIRENELYDRLLHEKDARIQQLEKDLDSQCQETLWLRKMLLEDMGCVRSMLHKMSNGRSRD